MCLADDIYAIKDKFPREEKYAMISQITRAATSIFTNIAEGTTQLYHKSELSFLSVGEFACWLQHANRQSYITKVEFDDSVNKTIIIKKMIFGYIKKLKQNSNI